MRILPLRLSVLGAMVVLALQGTAFAQATRTWVSGVGDDTNSCSRTAPCRTFAGAVAKTAAGGEVDVLDPGEFGPVVINKAITLASEGVLAAVAATAGFEAIVIHVPAGAVVTLRGLTITGAGAGLTGIDFQGGGELHVEKCAIRQFKGDGIAFSPLGTASALFVSDTDVSDNGAGIDVTPFTSGVAAAVIDRVHANNNGFGVIADNGAGIFVDVTVRDSVASGNTNIGLAARSNRMPLRMMLNRVVASFNPTGIQVFGAGATIWLGDSVVLANSTGLSIVNGGSLLSYGDSQVNGNGTDGTPSGPATRQ
jgi:parallel beta helix pectate lyase-like protein